MRLALACGRADVDRFMASLSSRQLAEWAAFEHLEGGIGDRAMWTAMAQLTALYAEAHRDPKRRSKPFRITDFLPWIEPPPPKQLTVEAFEAMFAGRIVKVKK